MDLDVDVYILRNPDVQDSLSAVNGTMGRNIPSPENYLIAPVVKIYTLSAQTLPQILSTVSLLHPTTFSFKHSGMLHPHIFVTRCILT